MIWSWWDRPLSYESRQKLWTNSFSILPSVQMEQIGTLALLTASSSESNLLFSGNTVLLKQTTSLSAGYFSNYHKKIPHGISVHERKEDRSIYYGSVFEHFVQVALNATSAESTTIFNGTKLHLYCAALLANLSLSKIKQRPFELSSKCKLRLFGELLGSECIWMPLSSLMDESYNFLVETLGFDFEPGTFKLPLNKEKVDGVIIPLKSLWRLFLECKFWKYRVTNTVIETI